MSQYYFGAIKPATTSGAALALLMGQLRGVQYRGHKGRAGRPVRFRHVLIKLDVSRFDAAPLIVCIEAKETSYGNEMDGRIPP